MTRDRVDLPSLHSMTCGPHIAKAILELHPLRAYEAFVRLGLVEAAMYHPSVLLAAGLDRENKQQASFKRLNSVLREYSPLCCLVGDDTFGKMLRAIRGGRVVFQMWRIDLQRADVIAQGGE